MFGSTGILIALIVVTIALVAVFLVRSSITAGATGKILAFVSLCALPALCIGTGMSFQNQRSKQTQFCISCHQLQGKSLYLLNPNYIPAHHFQDHLVPPDKACFTCHTDYAIYGPFRDKVKGLWNMGIQYLSTPPKTIHIAGGYNNVECLQCHAGTRDFEDHLKSMAPIALLETNKVSCISCHNLIHSVSEVDHMKMWAGGPALMSRASGSSSPAPAKAKPGTKAGASKASAGSSAGAATAAGGKGIFNSHGCSGCHGVNGGGGVGPALTHISSQYPPAKLTALLKAPTAKMKAAGMVPLTLNAADMKALVSYITSLGGASPASAAAPSASGASSPALANAKAGAKPGASTARLTKFEAKGKVIFQAHGCAGCHGTGGAGGTAAAPALAGTGKHLPPALLMEILKHPTALMQEGGMPPVSVNSDELKALVAYVSAISALKSNPN
ncbi:MAG TPA: c-type cytochrome [Patescibacteria group bacterium]|nr:c-type cytochrome [Patescibacteria group bacterium]